LVIRRRKALSPYAEEPVEFDKYKNRKWLIALGDAVCAGDPGFLIRKAFERGSIITGIRRQPEFDSLSDEIVIINVESPVTRSRFITDNYAIKLAPNMIGSKVLNISNNGSLEDLLLTAKKIGECIIMTELDEDGLSAEEVIQTVIHLLQEELQF
jgi:hypothetical protein